MAPSTTLAVMVALAGAGGGVALGQQAQTATPVISTAQPELRPAPLRRVESGVGDVDPLGVSLRQLSVDLRQPVGFAGVYQLPANRSPTGRAAFARISGATTAVFDQSAYHASRDGPMAAIPAGTVFYIGGLPERRMIVPHEPGASTAVSTAVDMRASAEVDSAAPATRTQTPLADGGAAGVAPAEHAAATRVAAQWPTESRSEDTSPAKEETPASGILGDEAYRALRVTQLLREAAQRLAPTPPAK